MILLCSASPRRRAYLELCGLPYQTAVGPCDESVLPGEPPLAFLRRITRQKLVAGLGAYSPQPNHKRSMTMALAADTVVYMDQDGLPKMYGKPVDPAQGARFLFELSRRPHLVATGMAVLWKSTQAAQAGPRRDYGTNSNHGLVLPPEQLPAWTRRFCSGGSRHWRLGYFVEKTEVTMTALSQDQIDEYVRTFRPFDKAGGYGIQDDFPLVAKTSGSWSNVVGLPLRRLLPLIATTSDLW